jgi:hypothetical protein
MTHLDAENLSGLIPIKRDLVFNGVRHFILIFDLNFKFEFVIWLFDLEIINMTETNKSCPFCQLLHFYFLGIRRLIVNLEKNTIK